MDEPDTALTAPDGNAAAAIAAIEGELNVRSW
jgi:hypothetical protein